MSSDTTNAVPSFAPSNDSSSDPIIVENGRSCDCENLNGCSNNADDDDDSSSTPSLTIKLLTTEAFNFQFVNYLNYYAEQYSNSNLASDGLNIVVESLPGGQQDLENRILELAEANDPTYAGYVHPSQITGSLVNLDALWDLTSFVRSDSLIIWPDVLNFYRERLAVSYVML